MVCHPTKLCSLFSPLFWLFLRKIWAGIRFMCYLLSGYFHFIMNNNRTGQRVVEAQGIAAYYLVGIYWIENDVGGMSRWAADCISMTAWFSRHYPFVSCFQHRPQYRTVITFFPDTNFQLQNIPIQNPNKMKQLALRLLLYQIETGSQIILIARFAFISSCIQFIHNRHTKVFCKYRIIAYNIYF